MRQRRRPPASQAPRRVTVARLERRLGSLVRRVQRLESHRRRIGFRAHHAEVDTDVVGEVWELDESPEKP